MGIVVLLLVLSLSLVAGVLLVSYEAAFALVLGFSLILLLQKVILRHLSKYFLQKRNQENTSKFIIISASPPNYNYCYAVPPPIRYQVRLRRLPGSLFRKILLFFLVILFVIQVIWHEKISSEQHIVRPSLTPISVPFLKFYRATFEPINNQLTDFNLIEEVTVDKNAQVRIDKRQLVRRIESNNIGLIYKELKTKPLNLDSSDKVKLRRVSGDYFEASFCEESCPVSAIKIFSMPAGAFQDADIAENLTVNPYLDQETISWVSSDIERGIRFAYIQPPYHRFWRFIKPFLILASLPSSILVNLGTIIAIILEHMLKPLINVAGNKMMTESYQSKYILNSPQIGNFIDTAQGGSRQQSINHQHNYAPEQKQTLAEAAGEIQQLLKQLEQTNPSATEADQTAFLTAVIPPTKRQRFANALREGGKEFLKELMDNMYLNVAIATIEGWQAAE